MAELAVEINGAEIFAAGTWNGITFSESDLDGIVAAFDALNLGGKIPLKLGHEGPDVRQDPTSQFAMGWVQRIWREGRKLLADLEVPAKVGQYIRAGMLRFVSVELLRDVRAANREIPWVLDAVALLGSDPPAVGVLKELRASDTTRRADSFPCSERRTFTRAERDRTNPIGDIRSMSEKDNPGLQEMMDRILDLTNRISQLETENANLRRDKAQGLQTMQRLRELEDGIAKRDRDERRAALKAVFDAAIADEEIVPSVRERFWRLHKLDEDEYVMQVTVDDAKQYIRENPNPLPRRKAKAGTFTLENPYGDVPAGMRADDEALMRVKAYMKANNMRADDWQSIVSATKEIFTQHKALGEAYKYLPDNRAKMQ